VAEEIVERHQVEVDETFALRPEWGAPCYLHLSLDLWSSPRGAPFDSPAMVPQCLGVAIRENGIQ